MKDRTSQDTTYEHVVFVRIFLSRNSVSDILFIEFFWPGLISSCPIIRSGKHFGQVVSRLDQYFIVFLPSVQLSLRPGKDEKQC